jgi:hypothetical protein
MGTGDGTHVSVVRLEVKLITSTTLPSMSLSDKMYSIFDF